MKFLQQPIEKKLSNLLGAKVTFERMKISPLAGRLEAEGMIVAGDSPDRPLLTVRRIDAQISVAKALAGQIAVKSLLVEGPEIFLVRREDGSLNMPSRPPRFAADDGDKSTPWQIEAESIRVEDGRLRIQQGSRVSTVDAIHGELKSPDGEIDLAAIELRGEVDINNWLSALPTAHASVRIEITLPFDAIFPPHR